ncbi:ChbG/HpnK family deacetylase [Pigmentiphaga sp.]|uniref:ChbG/HpnK family deacetylase n=1 Tax=Pigmentiphaga sp. TaxID=1977564 RepID=UPI0025D28808|nr:ChbG/HpnK family deacetylase [Pigmentiphaga sp.]
MNGTPLSGRRIVVCADDFGMDASVDLAILALAARERISAASCMTLGPSFGTYASQLGGTGIEIGLHLDFTAFFDTPAERPSLPALIARSYAGLLDGAWIDARLSRQFDAFERAFGRRPDYVDGHQHVHQLPHIRARLVALLTRRYADGLPWLRSTRAAPLPGMPRPPRLKARVIAALGAPGLARLARGHGLRTNERLLGVYGFEGGEQHYAALMRKWLRHAGDRDVLMCHPSVAPVADDPPGGQRVAEYRVLAGPAFMRWLDEESLRVGPLA